MNTFIKIPVNDPYLKSLKDAVQDWECPATLLATLVDWEYDYAQIISYIHSDKGCIWGKEADPAELLRQLREYFSPTYEYRAKRMWQMRAMSAILAAANNFIDWVRDWPTDDSQAGAAPQPAPASSTASNDLTHALHAQMAAIREHGKMIDAALTEIEREELNKYREQARAALDLVKIN